MKKIHLNFLIILGLTMILSLKSNNNNANLENETENEENSDEVEEQQLQISFLQTESEYSRENVNKMFEDSLALDDKYDPNLRRQSNRGIDLNNISKTTERDLDNKLSEDLQSEHA